MAWVSIELVKQRAAYDNQRRGAAKRGIAWSMSFAEWLAIWEASGHFHERGRNVGEYVMARFGDTGPYARWNVSIVTVSRNHRARKPVRNHSARMRRWWAERKAHGV